MDRPLESTAVCITLVALTACGRGESDVARTDVVAATPSAAVEPSADPLVPQTVEFPGDGRTLRGYLYRPSGAGPFPTIVFNHGSEEDPGDKRGQALYYVPHGFALFVPHRRGHGLSGPREDYFETAIASSSDRDTALVEQLELQVDDVAAAVAYAKTLPFVDANRIALVGCSFGGIESLFAAERDLGVRAAIDFAGASITWKDNPALQDRMRRAARAARVPVLLLQAENDYDTSPTRELDDEMTHAGKPHRARIFPPHGDGPAGGHAFCTGGAAPPWADEVSAFLASAMP